MKKIFTKLTLFALALVAGTQMAMAYEETEGTFVGSSTDGDSLSNPTDKATWIEFGVEKGAYIKFEVEVSSKDQIVDAKLL